jgi:hypothetical protein
MSNSFSKEERVAFEDILEGFQDALVLSRNVSVYNTDQTMMERQQHHLASTALHRSVDQQHSRHCQSAATRA